VSTGARGRAALLCRGHVDGHGEPCRLLRRAPRVRRIGDRQGSWSRLGDVRRMRWRDHRAPTPPAAPATRGEHMTRCGFSVLAVFCGVLALTPSASAECAWVLWAHAKQQGGMIVAATPSWLPQGAFQNQDQCERDRGKRIPGPQAPTRGDKSGQHLLVLQYVCLPDTVHPR